MPEQKVPMRFEMKDVLYILVILVGAASSYGAMNATINEMDTSVQDLKEEVKMLKQERDALIVVQTQQKEMAKRLDKSDEKLDKIYDMVSTLVRPKYRPD